MADIAHDLPTQNIDINMGPSHPAMHGTVRIWVELDGEAIVKSRTDVGFLHRGFEKCCESVHWAQVMPYTDRLNYVSPLLNNFGYAQAVERLIGLEIPRRAKVLRVILGEVSRIADHMTCLAAMAMEVGGFTPFLYLVEAREFLYDLIEEVTGARVTTNYARIGGLKGDLNPGWEDRCRAALKRGFKFVVDTDKMLTRNRIFMDRLMGVGVVTQEEAVAYGMTGPFLRSTGVEYDVRKAHPYDVYDEVDFDIPIGGNGDSFDRWLVRIEEMHQSRRIIEQALGLLEPGPVLLADPRFVLPDEQATCNTIQGLMSHFKLIIDGAQVPAGEVYSFTEAANGELGFYLVSDGSGSPLKCRVRSPCFPVMQAMDDVLLKGATIADVIPIFGSINMIGGECDR